MEDTYTTDAAREIDRSDSTGGGGSVENGRKVVSRRQFVRSIATAGVAVGVTRLSPLDDAIATGSDPVEIVYAYARRSPDDPASLVRRTRTVPADWYSAVTQAFEMHERLTELDLPGLLGSAVVPGNYDSPVASISVDVLPDAQTVVRERLAGLVDSVEFVVNSVQSPGSEEREAVPEDIRYYGDLDHPDVPGGVLCGNEDGLATLAPAMYDANTGNRFFATSNHLFGGERLDHRDEKLYVHPERGDRVEIGRYVWGYSRQDFIRVRGTNGFRPQSRLIDLEPGRVVGQFTRIGLADLMARETELRKVGARTGVTSGALRGIDAVTCYSGDQCRYGQLRWGDENSFSDGDSGSVSVAPDPKRPDEHVLVGGFNNARTWWPGQSFIWGTAAYHVTNVHGFHF